MAGGARKQQCRQQTQRDQWQLNGIGAIVSQAEPHYLSLVGVGRVLFCGQCLLVTLFNTKHSVRGSQDGHYISFK